MTVLDSYSEYRKKRNDYFASLRKLKQEYIENHDDNLHEFAKWIEEWFGFKIFVEAADGGYNITEYFEVTDEKLYTFFLLKYS